MDVVIRTPSDEAEVTIVRHAADTTLSDLLRRSLFDGSAGAPVPNVVFVDGRAIPTATPIDMVGLLDGAVIDVDGPDDQPRAAVVELVTVAGTGAGSARRLSPGRYRVGPATGESVRGVAELSDGVVDDSVDEVGLTLDVTTNGQGSVSAPGARLDGARLTGTLEWQAGVLIADGRAFELRRTDARPSAAGAPGRRVLAQGPDGTAAFNRPPRPAPEPEPDPLDVPEGGRPAGAARRFPLLALLAPLPVAIGMAVLLGNARYLLFGLLSPVMLLANYIEDRRSRRRERRQASRADAAAIAAFERAVDMRRADEVARRRAADPTLAELIRRAETTDPSLWERRSHHDDAFVVPLGLADLPWVPRLERRSGSIAEADRVLSVRAALPAVPVVVDLLHERGLGIVGDRPAAQGAARAALLAATTLHGPADLDVVVCAGGRRAAAWEWVKWLPHARPDDWVQFLTSADEVAAWADAVAAGHRRPARPTRPGHLTLVVADGVDWWRDRTAPLRAVLADPTIPVRLVAVCEDVASLPAVCTTYVELSRPGAATVEHLVARERIDDVVANVVSISVARAVARTMAPLDDPERPVTDDSALPAQVSILDVLDIDEPTVDTIVERWVRPTRASATAVGVDQRGPFVVDLVADGPHALVAGTTGAGKSELLRTLVVGLGTALPPDELNVVLIDFKGGSAFDACADLPHTVGLVTDLDEHLAGRMLRCLRAELGHRERVLREAGVASLDEQRRAGNRGPGPSLPRLVIVVDEFATLAAELGDFVPALVDIAQRGRSLGLHLVLATQRPAGVVDNKIKANTNLRIALRVQDDGDSLDVIGSRDASAIPRRTPGRAVARLGAGELVHFQSALSTGARGRRQVEELVVTPFVVHREATPTERRLARSEPHPRRARVDVDASAGNEHDAASLAPGLAGSDLSRLVEATRQAAQQLATSPSRRPYLDPLPAELPLAELLADDPGGGVPFARVDLPDEQRQEPRRWRPGPEGSMIAYGMPGSGTSSLLVSLAIGAASRMSADDLHLYAIDADANTLAPLRSLPHTGAVVGLDDGERLARMARHLAAEVGRRRRRALELGGPEHVAAAEPAVVLLVDNVGALRQFLDDQRDLGGVWGDLETVIRDGRGLGMCAVLTATQERAVPASTASLIGTRLALRLADRIAYAGFGFRPADLPRFVPGRALDLTSRHELQIGRPPESLSAAVAAIASSAGPARRGPRRIEALPIHVGLGELLAGAHRSGDRLHLPIGLELRDLAPATLVVDLGSTVLVAGPDRSGRSTAMAVIATAAHRADPALPVHVVAPRRGPLDEVTTVTGRPSDPNAVAAWVDAILQTRGPHLVLIDDADRLAGPSFDRLVAADDETITWVISGRADALRNVSHWTRRLRPAATGLLLRPATLDGELLRVTLPARLPHLDAGRGYLVHDGAATPVMVAEPDGTS